MPVTDPDPDADTLLVPSAGAEGEYRERGSRFRARVTGATSPAEARGARSRARGRHHDATHHVFASRLRDGSVLWDDDGEPSGTGGPPVLGALEATGVHDAVVVVTRWYGGTKLGTGPLARAYGEAARRALEGLETRRVRRGRSVAVRHDYGDTGAVMQAARAAGAVRMGATYGERAELELAVPRSSLDRFRADLRDATSARAVVRVDGGEVLVPDPDATGR